MNNTLKSLQKYNANHSNLTPRNKPILTQNEYIQSVNKLNTILNSLKVEDVLPEPQALPADQVEMEQIIEENETQPKTPRKRRTKKEIELDLQNIAQKQKDYTIEHTPVPPPKPTKPTKPKPPAKVISSTIASVKK